ncbi:hypothetical protein C8Q79DRAFT_452214 [Trametes meyenii]|nr:hypothetical protein C8Q79DRAFT_452214 [Trametes meyenii]
MTVREQLYLFAATTTGVVRPSQTPTAGGQGVPNSPRYIVPLLSDMDPSFKIEINVDKVPGIRLKSPFLQKVDAAEQCLDSYFRDQFTYTSRYMLPLKADHVESGITFRDPATGFTVGDLLNLLVRRQVAVWDGKTEVEIRVVPGSEGGAGCVKVPSDALYAVAIRRRLVQGMPWCFFLELEARM